MLKKVETVLSVPWTKLTPSESKPLLNAYIGSIPLEGKKRMALKLAKRYMGKNLPLQNLLLQKFAFRYDEMSTPKVSMYFFFSLL
jgi:hypothetical protein